MSCNFMSLNVRGIGRKEKRENVFQWLKEQKFDFYCLQEVHSKINTAKQWELEWDHFAYFSGNSSNSEGIAILVNKNILEENIIEYTDIIPGRLQSLEIKIKDQLILLINIYGPNMDNTHIFKQLQTYLSNNSEKQFIIAGDFNTVLDPDLHKFG